MNVENQERERGGERMRKAVEKLLEPYSQEIGAINKGMKKFGGNSRD